MRTSTGLSECWAFGDVRALACAVPRNVRKNADFPGDMAEVAGTLTGVRSRRIGEHSAAELCERAAGRVIAATGWDADSIDQLVVVTQTPERAIPGQGYDLHEALGLSTACRVIDINAGCAGYVQGLHVAMRMLAPNERALLLVGDTLESVCDPTDRATAPLFGDAGSATAIEGSGGMEVGDKAHRFFCGASGIGNDSLSQNHGELLRMRGADVFAFTLKYVPDLVEEVITSAPTPDYLLFHQANRFMLDHLTEKMGLITRFGRDRIPMNVGEFGNCSSASIPLLACDRLGKLLQDQVSHRVALFGYGAGWQWAGVSMRLGDLACCEVIEV